MVVLCQSYLPSSPLKNQITTLHDLIWSAWRAKHWRLSFWTSLPRMDRNNNRFCTYDFSSVCVCSFPYFDNQQLSWKLCKNWLCAAVEAKTIPFFLKKTWLHNWNLFFSWKDQDVQQRCQIFMHSLLIHYPDI